MKSILPLAAGILSATAGIPEKELPLNEMGWVILEDSNRNEAFDQLAYAMSLSYPLSEWKGVNWDEVYDELKPSVTAAVRAGDEVEYFRLVREFALHAHDGHVSVANAKYQSFLFQPSNAVDGINASFGFAISKLMDGTHIVIVQDGGPAAAAGVMTGMKVNALDGVPVEAYLETQPVKWVNMGMAHNGCGAVLQRREGWTWRFGADPDPGSRV